METITICHVRHGDGQPKDRIGRSARGQAYNQGALVIPDTDERGQGLRVTNPRVIPAQCRSRPQCGEVTNLPEEDRQEERPDVGEDDHQISATIAAVNLVSRNSCMSRRGIGSRRWRRNTTRSSTAGNQRGVNRPVPGFRNEEFGDAVDGAEDPRGGVRDGDRVQGIFRLLRASGKAHAPAPTIRATTEDSPEARSPNRMRS